MESDFHEFMSLTIEQKCAIVWKEGVYIAGRARNELTFNLYSVFSFYIEVCFNLGDDCIEDVQVSKNANLLEPYLHQINLPNF